MRRLCFVLITGILLKLWCVWIFIYFVVFYGHFLRSDVLNSFSKRMKQYSTETTTMSVSNQAESNLGFIPISTLFTGPSLLTMSMVQGILTTYGMSKNISTD